MVCCIINSLSTGTSLTFTFTWRSTLEDGTLQLRLQIKILLEKPVIAPLDKKFNSLLWRPEVQYHVHCSPQLDSILNHISPLHTVTASSLSSIITLSCHLRLGRPIGPLHLVLRPKPDKKLSSLPCLLQSPLFDGPNNI
jgi:hypothetical protein